MDKKQANDKKIMLVQAANDGRVKGVTDVDKDGNIQTADVSQGNVSNLLNVNTQDSALEAFFKKFMQEAEDPSHTGIFIMLEEAFDKLIKADFNAEELEKHRVDPAAELENREQGEKQSTFQQMDVSKIDMNDLERMEQGIYTEGFFNLTDDNIYKSQVIKDIDSNIGQLLKTDAKFYAIHVSPSEKGLRAMGNTEQEQAEAMKRYIREVVIPEYAKNRSEERRVGKECRSRWSPYH